MSSSTEHRIVTPGELLDDSGRKSPGRNTYREGDGIYALRVGTTQEREDAIDVIALSGRYDPSRGDLVIGTVVDTHPTNWYIDIRASSDVGMHVTDVPWRIEYGETSKYLENGDTVLLKVYHVDEMQEVQVTMKDQQCRKLSGGVTVDVEPSKVARIIGSEGSMIRLLKETTDTRVFVGQNGRIWLDGEPEDVALAIAAVRRIEAEAHTRGLTERLRSWIEEKKESGDFQDLRRSAAARVGGADWTPTDE